jgi:hypothetical protein
MMLTVDVGAVEHGPALTHPFRSEVRVPLQQPDANGFRTIEELEPMTQLEHRLTAMFERELNAWFVARFVWKGSTHLHYYHPMAPLGPVNLRDGWEPYRLAPTGYEDPEWSFLLGWLAPNELERLMSANASQLAAREQRGDRLDLVRKVDHVALFDDFSSAAAAVVELRGAEFALGDPRESANGVVLEFHREDSLDGFRPDEFVAEILDLVRPHGGRYDGWGAPIMR